MPPTSTASIPARWRAWAGIAGPAAFVAAWSSLGAARVGYSPVHDPISRLAAVGSSTRPFMTAGFVAFACGVGVYAPTLCDPGFAGARRAAEVTAAATLAVAVLPLGGPGGDLPHAVAAAVAYASLAAIPLLASGPLASRDEHRAALASVAAGIVIAGALAASIALPSLRGLTQRIGLTVGDVWIMAAAMHTLRVARTTPPPVPRRAPRRTNRGAQITNQP